MQAFRNPTGIMRTLNIAVLAFFVIAFYAPSAHAIKEAIEDQVEQKELEGTLPQNQDDTALYAFKLKQMKGHFAEAERLYIDKKNSLIGTVTDIDKAIDTGGSLFSYDERWKTEMNAGMKLAIEAIALNKVVDKDFASIKDWIKEKDLPELFLERHAEAYGKYETRYNDFLTKLEPLKKAKNEDEEIAALKQINKYLADQQFGRKHQAYDPEHLGHSKPASAEGKPVLITKSDYFRNGIESNPQVQVAQVGGGFDFSQLPGADDPAFLAESDEVVISQMIIDQAAELENDPVKIYHWVRNNIETIPGWGSYQNSELTLGARRGNPFDVASLTIALLRAAGIPSRYVMGAVDIDPERYTNWIGDFENADIASDYAVANGIAIAVVTSGGQTSRIRTQHIWVQAAIDYFPSRGAKNKSADAWVDLDPSFKQYEYFEGLDVAEFAGIDFEGLTNRFVDSGNSDDEIGFVQNLDITEYRSAQTNAQQAIRDNVGNVLDDPMPVSSVYGSRRTIVKEYPTLPSGLPYSRFGEDVTFGLIPNNLQNTAAIGFDGERTIFPFAQVNNEKVTLRFTPATRADEVALSSLLPEGVITDVSQLPSNIPSFLISVVPELTLNGEVFRKGNSMKIGEEINLNYQFSGPLATYAPYNYSVIAGSYLNVPLVAQSVSPLLFDKVQNKIANTKAILQSGDQSLIPSLTRDDLYGDFFYAGGLGYFSQSINFGEISNLQSRGSTKLEFGYGSYGYEPDLNTFFGITRGIKAGGIGVNMLFAISAESHSGDIQQRNLLRLQAGLISSALEHVVPEQMFSSPDAPVQGISAVRALDLASTEGQRIFRIDQDNLNQVMPMLNLDFSVEAEIRDSVMAGRFVIAHEENVDVPGFNGSGYLILDPETLIGSYKISGGSNGGFYIGLFSGLLVAAIFVATAGPVVLSGAALVTASIGGVFALGILPTAILASLIIENDNGEISVDCVALGFVAGLLLGFALIVNGPAALTFASKGFVHFINWFGIAGLIDQYSGNNLGIADFSQCGLL